MAGAFGQLNDLNPCETWLWPGFLPSNTILKSLHRIDREFNVEFVGLRFPGYSIRRKLWRAVIDGCQTPFCGHEAKDQHFLYLQKLPIGARVKICNAMITFLRQKVPLVVVELLQAMSGQERLI